MDSSEMTLSDKALVKLTRDNVLSLPASARQRWYFLLQVTHRELGQVMTDLMTLLAPDNETKIVFLIGMTGVGKTTLAARALSPLLEKYWADVIQPWHVPYVFVKAPANGEKSLSWRTLYHRVLTAADEILIEKKKATVTDAKVVRFSSAQHSTLAALRESLEAMLKERDVRILVVDEAFHLLRFEDFAATMDTLKSLADVHSTKLVLQGSFELGELALAYAQVARRGELLHYRRYKLDNADDKKEFKRVVSKLQQMWPCAMVPNFTDISDDLMRVTLGNLGLLKTFLLHALEAQLAAKGEVWKPEMLKKAGKSIKLLKKIREETEAGERAIEGAAYGETAFGDADFFKAVSERMDRSGERVSAQ